MLFFFVISALSLSQQEENIIELKEQIQALTEEIAYLKALIEQLKDYSPKYQQNSEYSEYLVGIHMPWRFSSLFNSQPQANNWNARRFPRPIRI